MNSPSSATSSLASFFDVEVCDCGRACALIAYVENAFGMTAHLRRLPAQRGDLRGKWASIDHARTRLGYRPRWSLEENSTGPPGGLAP